MPGISIKWKLITICISLVSIPTIVLGILSYNTFKDQVYQNIEKDLRIISSDWQKITNAYIEQKQRVLKREEVLVQQRLSSVAADVNKMLKAFHDVHGDNLSEKTKNILFDQIAEIKLGRSGYVSLLDTQGNYVISKNRLLDGKNLLEMDETKASFMRNIFQVFNKLVEGDQHLMHYRWFEAGYVEPRMKMSIISYFKPWKLIIGANIYYTDFKSYEIEQQLKYNLKHKMADQRIGEDGYIWVVNSKGEYVVSKDLLRDGENIFKARDSEGRFVIQEMISLAKKLTPEETAIYYYPWRNLGEPQAYDKVSAVTYIPEWDWILAASAYHKDFIQGLEVIKANIMRVCISAIFIGSLIAYFSALFISKPIKQLEKISMQASKGDLNAVIDPKILSHKDEIGSLAQSFNTMMINLKHLLKQQKETYREMAEAKELAEAANAAKSDFLACMSHEIRSPLNVVIGLTSIILKSELTREQRDHISKVKIASNNLLEVINDILDFSKVEAGRLDLTNAPFDLYQVMDQLADLFSDRTALSNLEFVVAVSPQVPRQLIGDANRLTQVLTNLMENAVKFTDEGEIVVEVKLDDQAPKNNAQTALKFQISDTGVGIAEEALPTLFDPFTQADRYLTRNHEGTGLGLAICRRLVELMGGSIEAKSNPGRGSTFCFTVVFNAQKEESPHQRLPTKLHGLKALVVDDNAMARQVLEDRLKSFTFHVSSVDSGDMAIEELRNAAERPYQLVLIDWKMPGMDGIETARRIRALNREEHAAVVQEPRPPIVIMTTAFSREQAQECINQKLVDALLLKPIKPSDLLDTIMRLFNQNRTEGPPIKAKAAARYDRLAGHRVLVVEDSALNRDVAMALLEEAGLVVESAENGEKAVEKVTTAPQGYYDVILMDIQMPGMDGYQATMKIKAFENKQEMVAEDIHIEIPGPNATIPIIALTAHAMTGEKEKCLEAGMDDYLTKPIDEQDLLQMLLKWIPEQ